MTVTFTTFSQTQIAGTFEVTFSAGGWGSSVPPDAGTMTGTFSTCSVTPWP